MNIEEAAAALGVPVDKLIRLVMEERAPEPAKKAEGAPDELDHPDFHAAWFDWIDNRRELKKPATKRAEQMAMRKLAGMGLAGAVWSLRRSVVSNWTDVYPPAARDAEEVANLRDELDSSSEESLGEDSPHDPFLDGLPRGDGRVWSSYYGELVNESEWMPMDDMVRLHGPWNVGVIQCEFTA